MDREEYYNRIEKIKNRFATDRVSADEEYQLVCQKNYLSTKYIEKLEEGVKHLDEVNCKLRRTVGKLEEQCKKQKEVINKIEKYIEKQSRIYGFSMSIELKTHFDNILKEVSK